MPIFRYKAYKPGGGSSAGTIEAEGIKEASSKIKALGLYPKSIDLEVKKKRKSLSRKTSGLAEITRRLSILLHSGVQLKDAVAAISIEGEALWKTTLIEIKERLSSGLSLSKSLEECGEGVFPDYYISMVAAGEESGTLDAVLDNLAEYLENQAAVKDKIRTATIYPAFMISVAVVVLVFIFIFVVPKIVKIFEDSEAALPLPTVILIGISDLLTKAWWLTPLAAIVLVLAYRRSRIRYKALIDAMLYRVFKSLYLTRFSRNLGFLLKGGLPMLKALELAGRAAGNTHMEGLIKDASLKVSEGASLSGSLKGVPAVLSQLISTGEKSGKLSEVLNQAANAYEYEFNRRIQKALIVVEPVIILLMGFVVGFIVFAVLLPMFQLNQLIR